MYILQHISANTHSSIFMHIYIYKFTTAYISYCNTYCIFNLCIYFHIICNMYIYTIYLCSIPYHHLPMDFPLKAVRPELARCCLLASAHLALFGDHEQLGPVPLQLISWVHHKHRKSHGKIKAKDWQVGIVPWWCFGFLQFFRATFQVIMANPEISKAVFEAKVKFKVGIWQDTTRCCFQL